MNNRSIFPVACAVALFAVALAACSEAIGPIPVNNDSLALSGGATTVFDVTSSAYSMPAPNLTAATLQKHIDGDAAFEATFVTSPATVNAGLGPVFNNSSCINCHPRDGRGRPPRMGEVSSTMLFRISVPGADEHGGPLRVPGFGGQLQDRAVYGADPEGRVSITYAEIPGTFADGTTFSLQRPNYAIATSYAPIPTGMMLSPRIGRPVFGLGLLEAIPTSSISALADESDRNGDGVSGRANMVWDPVGGMTSIGRFGWKAGAPSLLVQSAGAYNEDMGVTSSLFKFESCHDQPQYRPSTSDYDLEDASLEATTLYTQTLGVPARRKLDDAKVQRGQRVFVEARCSSCHIPTLVTGASPIAELQNQTIHPYTDLLLHDMGDGLADGRPDFLASGTEWRTPPLWGIGLSQLVNGHTLFLHDGRARNLIEAVMWHGGEAEFSRNHVRELSTDDRAALIAFLESL